MIDWWGVTPTSPSQLLPRTQKWASHPPVQPHDSLLKGDQEVEVLEESVGFKYVDGVMAEDKTERFFLCSMSNGRFLACVVYLPVSKFEGEGGPRFLPVRGRTWRLWGPPYEQRIGRRHSSPTLPAARNFLFAPEQYYWVAGLMPPAGRD